ncbi:type II toxin-antitoxin system HicA family toxin [Clostridium sp. 001]|uniref:type II toxin-antitoxin system HicA family toxin n=1 Tax=Clostridium sp. 001 TaxID=1970093 RepID=UPI0020B8B822|nr:type II toxin-antitoxin system HicA family toxin [Clostridium sp. 001]
MEVKLNNEFKKIQKKLEDYWFEDGNDKLSDFADKTIREKYFNIHNKIEEIKKICKSNIYFEIVDDLNNKVDNLSDEIMTLEALAYYNDMQKLSNTIHCRTIQTMGRITFVINTVCDEVVNPYYEILNEEIDDISKILHDKGEEFTSIIKEYPDKVEKSKVKKIFDYKKLNKLVKNSGFEEVRQTGDHKIFSDGIKSISIPQKTIGKGLSVKIQRQMEG